MNVTGTRLGLGGREVQEDSAFDDFDLEARRFTNLDYKPAHSRPANRDTILFGGIVGVVAWLVVLVVLFILSHITAPGIFDVPTFAHLLFTGLAYLWVAIPVLGIATWVGTWLYNYQKDAAVRRQRASLVRDKMMNPVDARLISGLSTEQYGALWQASAQMDVATAPYRQLRGVEAYSPSNRVDNRGVEPTLALPAPGVEQLPPDEWLPRLNDLDGEPHLLIAGKTKAGKSTLAEVVLAMRVERGDEVFIIDPHYQPVNRYGEITWCGLQGVGGGGWDEVKAALAAVTAEYDRRKKLANEGQMPKGGFQPLTVLVDEVPEIYENLRKEWESFSGVMGSGARKYSIYVVTISQSHLIKDIGGSTAKRENFLVLGLNEKARMLVIDEIFEREEKAAVLDTLRGKSWAAAMLVNGEVKLLDRTGIREMRPRSLVETAKVWSVRLSEAQNEGSGHQNGRTDERWDYYLEVAASGVSRKSAAVIIKEKLGGFSSDTWTEARRELGLID